MQVRFLLGPAGSGKTFRCLAEVRAALVADPDGPPLIFLAPKQATFQLERQLLGDPSLQGFARLHILSFERLARFVLDRQNVPLPSMLSDEGRLMVLRALLLQFEKDLKSFRSSARRPGFAQQLSQMLRELQQHQVTPEKLRTLAGDPRRPPELRHKLHDLALLLEAYAAWLAENRLQDTNRLLDFATESLRTETSRAPAAVPPIAGLWMDGFAEMTPQELDLLAATVPFCRSATLAFCLDAAAPDRDRSWLSIWNSIAKTFQRCREQVAALPGVGVEVESLPRTGPGTRFADNPELAWLERHWPQPLPAAEIDAPRSLQLAACANPDAEAIFAARQILRFVRAGNRWRDCALLVRNLEPYHKPLARTLRRYGIPFFLDRRESIAHHPLAELTRSAVRLVAFDWQHDDWFSALKSGFSGVGDTEIDRLENAALEFGWRGKKWREPLPLEPFERLRQQIFPPFEQFAAGMARAEFSPDGRQLADLLRALWDALSVENVLEQWSLAAPGRGAAAAAPGAFHQTVLEQMNSWLDNLALGFGGKRLPPRDWLPILEAGLAHLTVGIIPPVLDEVLIGAVDRARSPDLKLTLVLGANEGVFPAAPVSSEILTSDDRAELDLALGPDLREQISRERFFGYLACTRPRERLAVTFSRADADGKPLNPSPFIGHLRRLFPALPVESFTEEIALPDAEHAMELALRIPDGAVAGPAWQSLLALPAMASFQRLLGELREAGPRENLAPDLAQRLYGPVLRTSVSRLEEFASCPFRFFVRSGLRAEERKIFELDARERGSFQHDVLKQFHESVLTEHRRWRDLTPEEGRRRIQAIAAEMMERYHGGVLSETARSRFAARALAESLQEFVAVTLGWLREQYQFDPVASELPFGEKDSPETAWQIPLNHGRTLALRGRIDRVDLFQQPNGDSLAVVVDYKSSAKRLDAILIEHGVQLQLLAYLNVLQHWAHPETPFGSRKLNPVGVFYVNLRGQPENGTRAEVLARSEQARRAAYRHTGRFDADVLPQLDRVRARDQFHYRLTDSGKLHAGSAEALPRAAFHQLLDRVETRLREFGDAIFSGVADVNPYRKGKQTPCEFCDYRAACRIDPWTHSFRRLEARAADAD